MADMEPNTNFILISSAVEDEVLTLVKELKTPVLANVGGRKVISGEITGKQIMVVTTGPGVVNTAQALTSVIEKRVPGLLIQTGCAGVFSDCGAGIGDIGIAQCEIDTHIGIEPSERSMCVPADTLPFPIVTKNNNDITNRFPVNRDITKKAYGVICNAFKNTRTKTVTGPFITVSTITSTDKRARALYETYAPCMESMEGSSAAHIALHYNIPFVEIRAASNFVGKRDRDSWDLPLSFKRCNMAVLELIKNL